MPVTQRMRGFAVAFARDPRLRLAPSQYYIADYSSVLTAAYV